MSKFTTEVDERRASVANDAEISSGAVPVERISVRAKGSSSSPDGESSSSANGMRHGAVELVEVPSAEMHGDQQAPIVVTADELDNRKGIFAYLRTKEFYLILVMSQVLAICDTGTNTLTTLLADAGTSIPAFQSLFNYILLTLIYTTWTIYKYGWKGWFRLCYKDGWKFFILAFFDVEGNYFTVLAYRYTTILSAQLLEFWAIVVVVVMSLIFLKVRYHVVQYIGILVCVGGVGLMIASDHITHSDGGQAVDAVKGDLFCLLGATFYGLDNVFEEFLLSKRPLYEVVGQLSFWAMFINGVQCAIFNRQSFQHAVWNGKTIGYLVGYTLILTTFYSIAPLVLRMASAAFLNIGLLTGNFWGLIVGLKLFHLHVHWLYPVAFVLIIVGHFIYYGTEGVLGEARKPWLGENQEGGDDGLGTARRKLAHPNAIV